MNTNLAHNIINILITLVAGLEAFDWTPFLEPSIALKVVGVLGLVKLMINVIRDGVTGLTANQPPVVK